VWFVPPQTSSPGAGRGSRLSPRHRPGRNGLRVISVTPRGMRVVVTRISSKPGPRPAESSTGSRSVPEAQKAARWCRMSGSVPRFVGSTTIRSNRSGSRGIGVPSGARPRSTSSHPARRTNERLRWSTVSSANPYARLPRQRTSTTTSAAGGPGSTATRSNSWRPTWTFRARTVQPASISRPATSASAASPATCAAVRARSVGCRDTRRSWEPAMACRSSPHRRAIDREFAVPVSSRRAPG
jgi:hypothetical protein